MYLKAEQYMVGQKSKLEYKGKKRETASQIYTREKVKGTIK